MNSTFRPLLLLLCLLGGCQQSSTTPSATANTDSLIADRTFFGVHHVITKNGIRSSVLDGDSAYLHAGSETLLITGVKLAFFNEAGTQSGTLTSKKGEYDPAGGLFVAREDVVLVARGPDGDRRIETDQLNYQVKTDELWSDQPFVMKHAGRTTRGSRFKSDGKFTNWDVTNLETSGGLPSEDSGLSF